MDEQKKEGLLARYIKFKEFRRKYIFQRISLASTASVGILTAVSLITAAPASLLIVLSVLCMLSISWVVHLIVRYDGIISAEEYDDRKDEFFYELELKLKDISIFDE